MRIDQVIREEGLDKFVERTAIKTIRHGKYDNLVMLKYDMINCDMADPAVQQCRGVILDQDDNFKIVSFPYTKFFNHGDNLAHDIDWATARVFEKLDGSIMTLYHYDGAWQVASNGMPDAAGPVNFGNKTFAELFWETWENLGYGYPLAVSPACYMFEMMTPYNRIVVRHEKSRLVAHGGRCLKTYEEIPVHDLHEHELNWEVVQSYFLDDAMDALKLVEEVPGLEREGFVVVDHKFRRLKIKSQDYVRLHYLVSNMSYRRLLEIVQHGNDDVQEFLTYFPEYTEEMEKIKGAYQAALSGAQGLWELHRDKEVQKDFALAVKDSKFSAALFALRAGKTPSLGHWFADNDEPWSPKCITD